MFRNELITGIEERFHDTPRGYLREVDSPKGPDDALAGFLGLVVALVEREEAVMKPYCGIDLHCNNNVVVVIDETDRRVLERRYPITLE